MAARCKNEFERDDRRMPREVMKFVSRTAVIVSLIALGGCQTVTVPNGREQARLVMAQQIQAEAPGDYFIGRRYFKKEFHFWGYVRRPGQPWSTAQLVVLNEKQQLAPDREQLSIGSDNNCEYKLRGSFSGDRVYEPGQQSRPAGIRPAKLRADLHQPCAPLPKPTDGIG